MVLLLWEVWLAEWMLLYFQTLLLVCFDILGNVPKRQQQIYGQSTYLWMKEAWWDSEYTEFNKGIWFWPWKFCQFTFSSLHSSKTKKKCWIYLSRRDHWNPKYLCPEQVNNFCKMPWKFGKGTKMNYTHQLTCSR